MLELRISVIIPVYNAANYVEAAVASALQFAEVKEVVLVDDAGPDNSLAICQRLAAEEPRVKLYRHPGGLNRGAGRSRNLGIQMAREDLIAFLDADDRFLPNRFDGERSVFAEHPDADGVYGAIGPYFHDEESKELFERTYSFALTTVRERVSPERLFHGLAGREGAELGHFSMIALTIKRSALDRMDQLMQDLQLHEDTEFLIRLAWYARLYPGIIDAPVALRGVHGGNRYMRQRSFHSLYLFHKTIAEWMEKAGVDGELTAHHQFRTQVAALSDAPTKLAAWRIARKQWHYMHRGTFRDALFIRLAGEGTAFYKLLHSITRKAFSKRTMGPV